MYDENSEASFVLNGVLEFIKVWQSGNKSRLTLHSKNGKAWINFNCCLGGPLDQHKKIVPKSKPKSKSKKKRERDNLRAQLYQQRLQDKNSSSKSCDGSLNLQLSSLSSQNESVMEVESSSSIRTAASSSPKNGNPILETSTEKSSVSDSSVAKSKNAKAATVINEHTAVVRICVDKRENDCLKTNNQSCEASPTLKEPSVNNKDVPTPHNQQIRYSGIPLASLAELGRTRPPSKPAQVSTKSVNFNPAFPLPSAAPRNIPTLFPGGSMDAQWMDQWMLNGCSSKSNPPQPSLSRK